MRRKTPTSSGKNNDNVNRAPTMGEGSSDSEEKLVSSMRSLSFSERKKAITTKKKTRKSTSDSKDVRIRSFVHENLLTWTTQVVNDVGPNKKEISYHVELKRLLLSKGFDVGYETQLKYQRQGSKAVTRRADLIISMPGSTKQILIECKAKKKIEKKDFEQVIFYKQHFGISGDCYLVNFREDPQVLRLKE